MYFNIYLIKKHILAILIFGGICLSASGQKKKIHFQSVNSFGVAGSKNETGTAFQTINGIQFAGWFTGFGIGIDNYRYKTMPLFLDGRKNLDRNNRGFIYADIGYHIPMHFKPGKEIPYYDIYHFAGGVYTDAGIGIRFPVIKKISGILSCGYSFKKMKGKIGTHICPFAGPCYTNYSIYHYNLNRIIVRAGITF